MTTKKLTFLLITAIGGFAFAGAGLIAEPKDEMMEQFGSDFFEQDQNESLQLIETNQTGDATSRTDIGAAPAGLGGTDHLPEDNFDFTSNWGNAVWEQRVNFVGVDLFQDSTVLTRGFDAQVGEETETWAHTHSWAQGVHPFSPLFQNVIHPHRPYYVNSLGFQYLYKKQVEEYNPPIYSDTTLYNFSLDGELWDELPYRFDSTYIAEYDSASGEMDTTMLASSELTFYHHEAPGVFNFTDSPEPYWIDRVLNVWPAFNIEDHDSSGTATDTVWVNADSTVFIDSHETKHIVGFEQETKPVVDTLVVQIFSEYTGRYSFVDQDQNPLLTFASPDFDREAGIAKEDDALLTLRVPLHEDYLGKDPANWDKDIADAVNHTAEGDDRVINIIFSEIDTIDPVEIPPDPDNFFEGNPFFVAYTYVSGKPYAVGDTLHDSNRPEAPFGELNPFQIILSADNGTSGHPDGNTRMSVEDARNFYGPMPNFSATYRIFKTSNRYHPHSNEVVGDRYLPMGNAFSWSLFTGYTLAFNNTPLAIDLSAPLDGATGIEYGDELEWLSEILVNNHNGTYQVQIAEDENFDNIVADNTENDTIHELSGLDDNTQYFWRVRGDVDNNEGEWSEVRNFETGEFDENGNGDPNYIEDEVRKDVIQLAYPNPVTQGESFNIVHAEAGNVQVEVYNMVGQKVETAINNNRVGNDNYVEISTEALKPGVYFYKLNGDSVQDTGKFSVTE